MSKLSESPKPQKGRKKREPRDRRRSGDVFRFPIVVPIDHMILMPKKGGEKPSNTNEWLFLIRLMSFVSKLRFINGHCGITVETQILNSCHENSFDPHIWLQFVSETLHPLHPRYKSNARIQIYHYLEGLVT